MKPLRNLSFNFFMGGGGGVKWYIDPSIISFNLLTKVRHIVNEQLMDFTERKKV